MFKERLKTLRESKGLTQTQLSEELNIGRTSVSNYELGLRTPDIDVLVNMANFFDVTTDYLTGRSNFKQYDKESYFTDDEKKLLSKISKNLDLKNIEDRTIQEIEHFKNTLLSLYGSKDYNLKIVLSFIKNVQLLYSIYLSFSTETDKFINNLNDSMLGDVDMNSEATNSKKLILQILYTRLSELQTPTYNFSFNLSRLVEELFILKSDMESDTGKISALKLLNHIEASSKEIDSTLLKQIYEDYIGPPDHVDDLLETFK